jgi:hypothetical protein
MPYYDFNRHYTVKADSPKDAKVKFSRALENHEEDQYYVSTDFGYTRDIKSTQTKSSGLVLKILTFIVAVLGWFLKGALEQFTYTAPKKPKKYRGD